MVQKRGLIFIFTISCITFIISLFTFLAFAVFNVGFLYRYPINTIEKIDNVWTLSKNKKNIVLIMSDMMGGIDIASILKSNCHLVNNFQGFTNYRNLITTHTGTNAAVLNLWAGYNFNVHNKNHHSDFKNLTFGQYMHKSLNILSTDFHNANWDVKWISPAYYHYNDLKSYWYSNWQAIEKDFQHLNVQALSGPDLAYWLNFKHFQDYQALNLPERVWEFDNHVNDIGLINALSKINVQKTAQPQFLTISSYAVHTPVIMNQAGQYQAALVDNSKNVYWSIEGFLKHFNQFIEHLKRQEIYNNTMIILVSDHGGKYASLPLIDKQYDLPATGNYNYDQIKKQSQTYPMFSRHLPTLMIKPFNSNDPLIDNYQDLLTNTDWLTFLQQYNQEINFLELIQANSSSKRNLFLKKIDDIITRKNLNLFSYGNDSWWADSMIKYLKPQGMFAGRSFIVKDNIFELANYKWAILDDDYYSKDDENMWNKNNDWN